MTNETNDKKLNAWIRCSIDERCLDHNHHLHASNDIPSTRATNLIYSLSSTKGSMGHLWETETDMHTAYRRGDWQQKEDFRIKCTPYKTIGSQNYTVRSNANALHDFK
jgi:hypothetical protein